MYFDWQKNCNTSKYWQVTSNIKMLFTTHVYYTQPIVNSTTQGTWCGFFEQRHILSSKGVC